MTARPLPLGVLASGRGSNLQAILDEVASGRLAAAVKVVVGDVADAFALERGRRRVLYRERPVAGAGARVRP